MLLRDLDAYFRELMPFDSIDRIDVSLNGIQVDRSNQDVSVVAFAVDACLQSFRAAAERGADLLVVHHGLFWGAPLAIRNSHYDRVKFLLDKDMALYAAHLPLDADPDVGNNAGLADLINLEDRQPFGMYKGTAIGLKGRLPSPKSVDELLELMRIRPEGALSVLRFGPDEVSTVGIISGGGTNDVSQAIGEGLDLFVTGDAKHSVYHLALEEGINLVCGGHYYTEVFGVQRLAKRVKKDLGLETFFVDAPTGL